MKNTYKQKCKCGEKVEASTLHLLNYYKRENIINHGHCKLFKKHKYR